MLFNEPKLLKSAPDLKTSTFAASFSALQRAEIAESNALRALQATFGRFSALQRAEIAENQRSRRARRDVAAQVSVLFNEPKLLKLVGLKT